MAKQSPVTVDLRGLEGKKRKVENLDLRQSITPLGMSDQLACIICFE